MSKKFKRGPGIGDCACGKKETEGLYISKERFECWECVKVANERHYLKHGNPFTCCKGDSPKANVLPT